MTTNPPPPPPHPASRRSARLRLIGVLVLALGLLAAGLVYWLRPPNPDSLSLLGYDRPVRQQMGVLYGKSGQLLETWLDALKQPGTQAVLILVVAALAAAACFYFARLLQYDDDPGS